MDRNTEIPLDEIIELMLNAESDKEYELYKAYYYEHYIKPNKKSKDKNAC